MTRRYLSSNLLSTTPYPITANNYQEASIATINKRPAHRQRNQEPLLQRGIRNLPSAIVEGITLTFTGAIIGILVPGVPLIAMGEPTGIFLGMEIGGILFGVTAFLSGLVFGLPSHKGRSRQQRGGSGIT